MSDKSKIKRRQFLAGAVAAPAAVVAAKANAQTAAPARSSVPAIPQTAGDTQPPAEQKIVTSGKVGGDFMVDVLKALDIDYVASCPGSTFRGLQESIINYANNTKPEFITCLHEEASVAMGHGYAKIAGKPLATMVHGVVGTQHASMAIYNCFADQAPCLIMAGNVGPGTERRPGVEWAHSAHDQAIIVRDYVKWDDQAAQSSGLRRRHGARLRPRHHRADGSRLCGDRRRTAGRGNRTRPQAVHPEVAQALAAGRRSERACRDGEDARRRRKSGDHREPLHAYGSWPEESRLAGRDARRRRDRRPRPHEHAQPPSLEPHRARRRGASRGRRRARARAARSVRCALQHERSDRPAL